MSDDPYLLARNPGGGYRKVPVVSLDVVERLERAVDLLQLADDEAIADVAPEVDAAVEPEPGPVDDQRLLERLEQLERSIAEVRSALPPGFLRKS